VAQASRLCLMQVNTAPRRRVMGKTAWFSNVAMTQAALTTNLWQSANG